MDGVAASTEGHGRGEVLWEPPSDAWTTTAAGRFAAAHGHRSYPGLHAWSVTDLDGFWTAVSDDLGVRWHERPTHALAEASMPGARWFPGGTLSYAEHALAAAADRPDDVAVVARSQTRDPQEITWGALAEQVARCAAGLRRLGVAPGDRVAAYAPNIPETLVAFLATASIGAVWSSCAPEFGTRSVIDRLGQIEPSVLLAVDGYRYGAKAIDRTAEVAVIEDALPGLRHTVRIPYLDRARPANSAGASPGGSEDGWADLLAGPHPGPPTFAAVPFDHPLYILFSSGTTGLPKAIVHGHGGITVEHLKTLTLHQDLTPADRFLWFTTTGWMMWNYLVSGLLTGSTIVLFDGDPAHPSLATLWDVADETGTTVFGASAPFLMACRKEGLDPARGSLRWVGSTGAPLPAEGFRWVRDAVGVPVSSISGGTDVCTAFLGTSPLLPVRAGELSCRLLGCAVEAVHPDGTACAPGELGELVVTVPMPSMPVGFWGDDDGSRYRAAYFEDIPGVWRHGDWVTFTADGAATITGRSDATLNRGGVRLGTSDFYTVVEGLPEVADSLVVHLEGDDGGAGELILFVALAPGVAVDEDELGRRIGAALRSELSPRHVPDRLEVVPAVPRTLSGKKLEVPVKRILTGTPVDDAVARGSLADPSALDAFERLAPETPPTP
ncbi:acetoacetate--CoA ligase [Iamia sp. SCSIO 61187]|uniref:acetoacetate--CoA ligase n=1 Tax=Iamia sp. SCSIO 61187 TaxID=2722752 RepID=UPI001C629A93|nr:acetoacetate--CoA ligase [Iamia sp. SCSIO 61187]QYG93608.1 acetoacetate--CoA ligase [Iamia sp. SCSIO 61187]